MKVITFNSKDYVRIKITPLPMRVSSLEILFAGYS
jgi:hypothetical protein